MPRLLLALFGMLLLAGSALAQDASTSINPSLLDSEPVEEDVPADTKPSPPAPAPKPADPADAEVQPEYDTAMLRGLGKVTGATSVIEAPVDSPVAFGTLTITVKKCVKSAPGERPENTALILIQDTRPGEQTATVFSGWMFSSSPAISALEHPVYDITMLECAMKKKKPEPEKPKTEKPKKSNQR